MSLTPGESSPPPPSPRVGDAERDAAVDRLRDHLTAGRLTETEFAERMSAALEARTQRDLETLFADLPDVPGAEAGSSALQTRDHDGVALKVAKSASVALWPIAIILFATGHAQFALPVMFLAIFGTPALFRVARIWEKQKPTN